MPYVGNRLIRRGRRQLEQAVPHSSICQVMLRAEPSLTEGVLPHLNRLLGAETLVKHPCRPPAPASKHFLHMYPMSKSRALR